MAAKKVVIAFTFMVLMVSQVMSMSLVESETHNAEVSHKNLRVHNFSPSYVRISNLGTFSDQQFAQQLKEDLNQEKDSERKLKQISLKSAEELFKIFGLKGIKCDNNNDGIVAKQQLQCLNFIWKYYVPLDNELGN